VASPLVSCLAIPSDGPSILVPRATISYNCSCIDHWFWHERGWIRASAADGCMSLELVPSIIYKLNALTKPTFRNRVHHNLVCSLSETKCAWTYSPLDVVSPLGNSSTNATQCYDFLPQETDSLTTISQTPDVMTIQSAHETQ